MEYRKGILKQALAQSLRELMLKRLFSKITIKQICDDTGVIRATFYNYFDDKYDCLDYIVYEDIAETAMPFVEKGDLRGALKTVFTVVQDNKEFYRIAYDITGQNNFEDMVKNNLQKCLNEFLNKYRRKGYLEKYSSNLLARYYANSLEFAVHYFVFDRKEHSVDAMVQMTVDLMTNLFKDFSTSN